MASGCDYSHLALLVPPPPPASGAVHLRVPVQVRFAIVPVPQQYSPAPPQDSHKALLPLPRHTCSPEHVPPVPPQQP